MTNSEQYREGDLIRATKNGETMQGKLKLRTGSTLGLDEAAWGLDSLEQFGWTIELLERAPDRLPTEPGLYVVTFENDEEIWEHGNGDWYQIGADAGKFQKPENFLKIERLYTKDQVMIRVRTTTHNLQGTDYSPAALVDYAL